MVENYDVIVIGGGAAGLSAAFTTAGFGKTTLLVEKNRTGGECTWSGCIPSKALIHLAEVINISKKYKAESSAIHQVFTDVDTVRREVYSHETPEIIEKRGIKTLIGSAAFIGRDMIEVDGRKYRGKRFILTIGSKALLPPVPGLAETPHLTNESLFELKELPKSILVMGGGPIGLEMAQALSRLGVETTVVEMLDRILFREDADAAEVIRDKLASEGVTILTGAKAVAVSEIDGGVSLTVETAGRKARLEADSLLVAVGRGSAVDGLNPEAAGVQVSAKGVRVNRKLQTANPRIYAAGDTAGPYAFSHMAEYQGVLAAMNAILPFKRKADYRNVAWTTFTDPEIARSGMLEEEARERYGKRVKVYTHRFEDLDRGKTIPGTTGIVKIILGPGSRILGAHIAGPRAGEIISEIQVLKTFGIGFHKLRRVIHPYPTYADILRQISKKVALDRIFNHPLVRIAKSFTRK